MYRYRNSVSVNQRSSSTPVSSSSLMTQRSTTSRFMNQNHAFDFIVRNQELQLREPSFVGIQAQPQLRFFVPTQSLRFFAESKNNNFNQKVDQGAKKVEEVGKKVGEKVEQVKDAAQHTWDQTKDAAKQASKEAYKQAPSKNDIKEKGEQVKDSAKQTWDQAKDTAKQVSRDAYNQTPSKNDVKDAAKQTWEQTKDKAAEKGQEWKETAQETAKQVKDKAAEKGQEWKETAQETAKQVKDKVVEKGQQIKDTATSEATKEKLSEGIQYVKDKVAEAAQLIKEKTGFGSAEQVKADLEKTAHQAGQRVQSATDKAKDTVSKYAANSSSYQADAQSTAQKVVGATQGAVAGAASKVNDLAGQGYQYAKDKGTEALHKVEDKIDQTVGAATSPVIKTFQKPLDKNRVEKEEIILTPEERKNRIDNH